MSKITLLIAILFCVTLSYSQTKIAKLTFENDPTSTSPEITDMSYTVSPAEFTDFSNSTKPRYFIRSKDADVMHTNLVRNTDLGEYSFGVRDNNQNSNVTPSFLNLESVDISGYDNIQFKIYLAIDTDAPRWDASNSAGGTTRDYVDFEYGLDGGTPTQFLYIRSDDTNNNNTEPWIDLDLDGVQDAELTNTFTQYTIDIPTSSSNILDISIEFNLDGLGEDIVIDNIEIWGTPIGCSGSAIWDGNLWSNGSGPDINTPARIEGDYNTDVDGDFSACYLIVSSGATLTITENHFVEVSGLVDISTGSNLIIENKGTLVQHEDSANFILVPTATSKFIKTTEYLNNWYDYTYWSSPVHGLTINTSPFADTFRRYWFNGSNYVDNQIEILNTNTYTPGQDDIDDNGDDWQVAGNAMTIAPGTGIVASRKAAGFSPGTYDYEFSGRLNTGVIDVNVSYNATNNGLYWNLLGNPYPGALDFDAFATHNSDVIEGAAYLWSQATPPSSNASGSDAKNFAQDYIIINSGSGSVNNNPDTLLDYIPSAQSFFVVMKKTAPINTVTFNNSMRVTNPASNAQFFKSSNSKQASAKANKLWINLTTNSGGFNQVLLAYVDGATDKFDGLAYDAPRNLSSGLPFIIYTSIDEKLGEKYAIQGKSVSSLNASEIVPLGFSTSISSGRLYTLSIGHFQGEFFNTNSVFLKDNLLGLEHNLSDSEYAFTSESGDFSDRFEIVYTSKVLSDDISNANEELLKIYNLQDKKLMFKAAKGLSVQEVVLYDVLGRKLYEVKGQNNTETFSFNNLSQTAYVAKVRLSNNQLLTRKIVLN
ncbi:hypothetical protein VQ01_10365 [Tamlana sp. s12]|nr:hypothetical protein VQ01_10365 [Tamlana sp. s12]